MRPSIVHVLDRVHVRVLGQSLTPIDPVFHPLLDTFQYIPGDVLRFLCFRPCLGLLFKRRSLLSGLQFHLILRVLLSHNNRHGGPGSIVCGAWRHSFTVRSL
jgi:hypothetical protein